MKLSKLVLASVSTAAVALALLSLHAQQVAKMTIGHDGAVEAGSTVTFLVTLDKAANVEIGSVSLNVEAEKPDPTVPGAGSSAGPANPEKTIYRIPVTIPLTAHSGAWHVTGLQLNLSGTNKPLSFDPTSFEVKEKTPLILPDRASIKVAK
jgi:hypothetical protein